MWFASKQLEGEITWVGPTTFVFGSGPAVVTPNGRQVRFRYHTTVHTADVVYSDYYHAWIVGRGPRPAGQLHGRVLHPDPVEVSLFSRGRKHDG